MAAVVHVTIQRGPLKTKSAAVVPVLRSQPDYKARLTTTGAVQQTGLAASRDDHVWVVTVTGGSVDLAFGRGAPDPSSDPQHLMHDGETRDFGVTEPGETLAVKGPA